MNENRWTNSPVFFNPNVARKIFKGTKKGRAREIGTEMLIPSNFGLSDKKFSTLTLTTFFEDNNFLTKTKLEGKLGTKMNFLDYVNLKQIMNKNTMLDNGKIKDLNDIEMPEYFCKRLNELFDPKYKGSQRFRKIFKYDKYSPPQFESEKWEKYSKLNFVKVKKGKF